MNNNRTFKNIAVISALSIAAVVGTAGVAAAQGTWNHENDRNTNQQTTRQQQRAEQQRIKAEQERVRAEQQRVLAEQRRQAEILRQNSRNDNRRYQRDTYNNGQWNRNVSHYRVVRNGVYYNTDQRGAELLRQAVNAGYQQGYEAGRTDRSSRRRSSYTTSNIYRSGNYGYQSYVDQNQYQYYFQQGFQRGYQDGYSSRFQYGSNNGGGVSILGSILGSILNIQTY